MKGSMETTSSTHIIAETNRPLEKKYKISRSSAHVHTRPILVHMMRFGTRN